MLKRGPQPSCSAGASVNEALAGHCPSSVRAANLLLGIPAPLADENVRHIGFADLGTREVDPGSAFVTFNHGPPCKGLHAEAGDQIPGIIVCSGRERDTGQTPPYQPQVWLWPDQPVVLVLNGTDPHSPSALVLGTSANSTAKVAKGGKKEGKK